VLATACVCAAALGIAIGWVLYGKDAETQRARDTFEIPVLYPLLRRKYYIDDLYMGGLVNPIKGPIARGIEFVNGSVIDGMVNGVAYLVAVIGRFVYGGLDQRGIDLAINATAGGTSRLGETLRFMQTGKVQHYAGAFVVGAVVLVVGFVIFT